MLLLALSASKCDKKATFMIGTPFMLKVGETMEASDGKVSVMFKGIKEDSRCPKDVTCIQAGRAIVELSVMEGPSTAAVQVTLEGSGASMPGTPTGGAYTISLQKLDPWPVATKPTATGDYVATLLVEAMPMK